MGFIGSKKSKIIFVTFLICVFTNHILSTPQATDPILIDGEKCEITYDWGGPTPLEYYFQNSEEYEKPFYGSNSGNWRGHIAYWEIKNSKLFLEHVEVRKKKFDIYKYFSSVKKDHKIFADWYTGVILVKSGKRKVDGYNEFDYFTFFVINKGKIEKTYKYTTQDYHKKLEEYQKKEFPKNDLSDPFCLYSKFIHENWF